MSNIDTQAGEGDVSPKTYYIHPMAFGGTQNPGHGHVPVVHADDFEKLRAKLEAKDRMVAEILHIISSHTIELGWGEKPITLAELIISREGSGSDALVAIRAYAAAAGKGDAS